MKRKATFILTQNTQNYMKRKATFILTQNTQNYMKHKATFILTQNTQNYMKYKATPNLRPEGFCVFCEFCVNFHHPAGSAISADSA